jgi:hypothetical protein
MSEKKAGARKLLRFDSPATFRIVIQGKLDAAWSDQLAGMEIVNTQTLNDESVTVLIGRIMDQTALMGVLNCLYEMHFPLIKVEAIDYE